MATLVEQIQRDAVDSGVPVATVLRRMKLAAAKLGIAQIEKWIEFELNGYPHEGDVPPYRRLLGTPIALDAYHRRIPVIGELPIELTEFLARQPIESIEDLLTRHDRSISFSFPSHIIPTIGSLLQQELAGFIIEINRARVIHIVNAVRDAALNWSIELERRGVAGSEFAFSTEDRSKAQGATMSFTTGPIGTFVGNLGSGNTSGDISTGNIDVKAAASLGEQLSSYLPQLEIEGVCTDKIKKQIDIISTETNKDAPSQGIIRGALTDVRNTLSGAGGSLLASGIITGITKVLGG